MDERGGLRSCLISRGSKRKLLELAPKAHAGARRRDVGEYCKGGGGWGGGGEIGIFRAS